MRISPATEERVLQAARTLDYRRRLAPETVLPAGAPAIGLISDVVATETFAGEMIRGCIAAATDRGHVVLVADTEGVDDLEASAVHALRSRGIDKFIYATMATTRSSVPAALRGQRLVLANTVDHTIAVPAVVPDDTAAGRTAAQALVQAGHTTRIWLVGRVVSHGLAGRRRMSGITAGLRDAGLRLAGHLRCPWWPDESREAVTRMFIDGGWDPDPPTAVIALNDRAAMGVYQAVAAVGLRVPDDLSVISFDNSDVARWLHPGLSSLALPYFDLGRCAVELLLTDDVPPRVHKLPMELRSRASVAAPSGSAPAVAAV
jgi:LacI family transcriptional regulator